MRLTTLLAVSSLCCVVCSGCGSTGVPSKELQGTVTFQGEPVEQGTIRFVPVDGTPGPACVGQISRGKYCIKSRGGVPLGSHRVEINAQRKTGRQVLGHDGLEETMIDETIRVGPAEYATDKSPLRFELCADSDGRFDVELAQPEGGTGGLPGMHQ